MGDAKDAELASFEDPTGPPTLLSSEVGSD
jgi:hypothetical protein